jgi:hypothetical protein
MWTDTEMSICCENSWKAPLETAASRYPDAILILSGSHKPRHAGKMNKASIGFSIKKHQTSGPSSI